MKVWGQAQKRGTKTIVGLYLLLVMTGCIPEFANPLPYNREDSIDDRLLHRWANREDNGDENNAIFFKRADGWYDIVFLSNANSPNSSNGLDSVIYEGYSSTIGSNSFLSFRGREKDIRNSMEKPDRNNFCLAWYVVTNDRFDLYLFSESKIHELIDDGVLKGETRTNGSSTYVVTTASPEELRTLLSTNELSLFCDVDKPWRFEKSQ